MKFSSDFIIKSLIMKSDEVPDSRFTWSGRRVFWLVTDVSQWAYDKSQLEASNNTVFEFW